MVKRPFISWVSQRMFNFENSSSQFTEAFPSLVGCMCDVPPGAGAAGLGPLLSACASTARHVACLAPRPPPLPNPAALAPSTAPPTSSPAPPRFGELAFRFPEATCFGVAKTDLGIVELNPPPDYVVGSGP
jgi:hypothetical protein